MKAGTALKSMSAIELGKLIVSELIQRAEIDGKEVQGVVFGTVVPSVVAPNIAREVSLIPALPKGVQAFTVSRACASANQAITDAADQIALGHMDVAIAGGAEHRARGVAHSGAPEGRPGIHGEPSLRLGEPGHH